MFREWIEDKLRGHSSTSTTTKGKIIKEKANHPSSYV